MRNHWVLALGLWAWLTLPGVTRPALAVDLSRDEEAPAATLSDAGEAAPAPAVAAASSAATEREDHALKLTQVRIGGSPGAPRVHLVTTGRPSSTLTYLTGPERLLIKLSDTLLTWRPTTLTVSRPPLARIRAAQHGPEAWVVFDLSEPAQWTRRAATDGLHLAPVGPAAARPAVVENAAENTPPVPRSEIERPAPQPTAFEEVSYRVVDVQVDDLGERTRVTVTTDGPPRYRVQRAPRGEEITLVFYGAGSAWTRTAAPAAGAVARVSVRTDRLEGEPVVVIGVRLVKPTPYLVLKEQNQVVLELDNPMTVSEAAPSRGSLQSRLTVDFQGADLLAALRALAQDAGFDLVLTPGAQDLSGTLGLVTVAVKEQPLEKVLDLVLGPRKLAYEVSGNTLRVGLASEFPVQTRVFSLKNLDVRQSNLKDSLEGVMTEGTRSRVIMDEFANRVIVTGIPGDLRRAENVLNRMDTQPRLISRTFPLSYAEADKLAGLLRPMLSSQGNLEVSARENALVLTDIPGTVQRLAGLIRSLDTKSKQVMIEGWIVEIALNHEVDLGVTWSGGSSGPGPNTISGSLTPDGFPPVGSLTVGTVQANFDLSATLSALEAKGVLNTLSNPRIATLDNKSASLTATQNLPYQTSYDNAGVIYSKVEYLQLPITLSVTPHITRNNQVLFDPVTLSVTTAVGKGTPPETTTRSASTQMTVGNGEIVAIGGLVRDIERTRESKVPLLGDIPVLGALFRSTSVFTEKVELVVFLTPHVLD